MIAIQYVRLRLLLKIINLYKISQYIDYQHIKQILFPDAETTENIVEYVATADLAGNAA